MNHSLLFPMYSLASLNDQWKSMIIVKVVISIRTSIIEFRVSVVECWISTVNRGYSKSFAFRFPYIPIYWLYRNCYLFRTWSKCSACVKMKSFHSYIYMGWNIDIQRCYALRNRQKTCIECVAQLIAISAAIDLDRFEFSCRSFQ